jgi:hypothetical protein
MIQTVTTHWRTAVLWLVSLIIVGALSGSAAHQLPFPPSERLPEIISGNDVGFRIDRTRDGIPAGRIVVRVNGRWVDTARAASGHAATTAHLHSWVSTTSSRNGTI